MKIKEFSEEKQLSRQAVYKALSRSGYSAKELTDRSGNLTKKGLTILNRLFPADGDQVNQDQPEPPEQDQSAIIDELRKKVDDLQNQVDEQKRKCDEWESRYFEAVNQAKTETEQLRVLIQHEQELRLYAERKGIFKRLFVGRKEKTE